MINKDTELYGSFSVKAGNNGCQTFNACFKYYGLNAIYKSFSITNIEDAVAAARTLGMKGFAVSMPFKKEVIKYLDIVPPNISAIGAVNTVLNVDGKLIGQNTDRLSLDDFLSLKFHLFEFYNTAIILGDGGFAAAARYACDKKGIRHETITRNNWNKLKDLYKVIVLNCTPVENIEFDRKQQIYFFDLRPDTMLGKAIAEKQAGYQFKMYTNLDFPLCRYQEYL